MPASWTEYKPHLSVPQLPGMLPESSSLYAQVTATRALPSVVLEGGNAYVERDQSMVPRYMNSVNESFHLTEVQSSFSSKKDNQKTITQDYQFHGRSFSSLMGTQLQTPTLPSGLALPAATVNSPVPTATKEPRAPFPKTRSSRKGTAPPKKACSRVGCGHMEIQGGLTRHHIHSCKMRTPDEIAYAATLNKCRICGAYYARWNMLVSHFEERHPDVENPPKLKQTRYKRTSKASHSRY